MKKTYNWALPAAPKKRDKRIKATIRERVDFLYNQQDFAVALLGQLGFLISCITSKTKLSKCQVSYRLRKAGVKLADFRNGKSHAAVMVLKTTETKLVDYTTKYIKQLKHA